MALEILKGESFDRTVLNFREQIARLTSEIKAFIDFKQLHPANGFVPGIHPGYGDSDKRFRSGGHFTSKLKDIAHAHLTPNISIVYRIENGKLYLYGIYTHDQIGTGQPSNVNRQNQMATRWANEQFSTLGPTDLATKEKSVRDERRGPPAQYAPKAKQQQPAARPQQQQDPVLTLAKAADTNWPDRNLYNRLQERPGRNERLAIVNDEIENLRRIASRNRPYPNQIEYAKNLSSIFSMLTKR